MKKVYLLIAIATSLCFAAKIGVLKNANTCPNGGGEVMIRLDTEDDSNRNKVKDNQTPPGINVNKNRIVFRYCVYNIDEAPRVPYGYAVLRLSQNCPTGSYAFARHHDSEDDDNNNQSSGSIWPSVVNRNATLQYCFVPADAGSKTKYPFRKEYGVFAANPNITNISHSEIYIDDEDDPVSGGGYECEQTPLPGVDPIDWPEDCRSTGSSQNSNSWLYYGNAVNYKSKIQKIMSGGENTTMHVIKWNGKSLKKDANMVVVDQAAPAVQSLSPEIKGFDHSAVTVELKSAGSVNVSIVNLKGAVVANIARENLQPGFHSLEWHSGIVPNGRYIVTVKQNGLVSAKNVILK